MRSMSIFYSVLLLCVSRRGLWGSNLVSQLQEDRNLDLPEDDEYEDLRAELLAYHTAFASLAAAQRSGAIGPDEGHEPQGRRSLGSTPCWQLGGICIKKDLCPKGNRFLTEVNGCRDNLRVCCFTWNEFKLKDMTSFGIKNWAYPWSVHYEFGGDGFETAQGGQNGKDDDSKDKSKASNVEDEESGENKEYKPSDINKSISQEKQPSDSDVDNNAELRKHKRRLRKRANKQPLAVIVKT